MANQTEKASEGHLFSQLNWLEKRATQSEPIEVYEYDIYSDARFTGQIENPSWPYSFLNTVPRNSSSIIINTPMVIRAEIYAEYEEPELSETDESRYHGGYFYDEIIALATACLGVRLAFGGISRRFEGHHDRYGLIGEWDRKPKPPFEFHENGPMLPDAIGTRKLGALNRMESIVCIEPSRYSLLVRACSLYRNALWIAESDPNIAWLLLVSALETAANDIWPGKTASKKKFVDVVLRFMPEPPKSRPKAEHLQFEWTEASFEKMLRTIYDYRSRSLHEGKPFPAPMSMPPFRIDRDGPGLEVASLGSASATRGGSWVAKDAPINLNTFHYIARKCLLKWWKSMSSRGEAI